jgi:hypothetical protein
MTVSLFDLVQHLLNVGSGERMPDGRPQGFQLDLRRMDGFAGARLAEGPAHPLAHRYFLPAGQAANFIHLLVGEQDLKTLTHSMSIAYSYKDHTLRSVKPNAP